ncbi:MAG: hypothetical protein ACO1Q7_00150 [Gemmatimonas sp.]
MLRSPSVLTGLRAAALAALLGGQSACVRSAPPVLTAPNASLGSQSVATPGMSNRMMIVSDPTVVVRDYWNSYSTAVVSWDKNEDYQGLRAAVLRDGSVAYDHVIYLSTFSIANPRAFYKAKWFAFVDAEVGGNQLLVQGVAADQFNCQGKKGCTPYLTYRARVPDSLLRNSRDSLVVKVVAYDGYETDIAIRGDLIASHLAKVDSISARRKMPRIQRGN